MNKTTLLKGAGSRIKRKQNPLLAVVSSCEGQPSFNMTDDTILPPKNQNSRTVETKEDYNFQHFSLLKFRQTLTPSAEC